MPAAVKPTRRERNRYVAVTLDSKRPLDRKEVGQALWDSYLRLFGESGAADAGLWLMDWEENRGVIKVTHKCVETLRQAVATLQSINQTPVRPRIIGVSGTLKKTREHWLKTSTKKNL
ncbi:Ribonuclease P protein component 2 [uncultured archaeon]|nr:Ribonuclease P protein component 2 [uncultured archaeon]